MEYVIRLVSCSGCVLGSASGPLFRIPIFSHSENKQRGPSHTHVEVFNWQTQVLGNLVQFVLSQLCINSEAECTLLYTLWTDVVHSRKTAFPLLVFGY